MSWQVRALPRTSANGTNYRRRLRKVLFRTFLLAPAIFSLALVCVAQRGNGSILTLGAGKNILWGDLKVDEKQAGTSKRLTYSVILYTPSRNIIGRQPVSNGGRYRFLDLADGEYDVAVEVEDKEITRFHVVLASQPSVGKTDTRHDIDLEWRVTGPEAGGTKPATVAAEDFYQRSEPNERLFSTARKATDEKKYEQAIASLRRLLENDAKDFLAWTELGTVYLLKGANDDAEKSYLGAIEVRPSFFLANLALGRLYLLENKSEKAIESLHRAVEIKAQSADANQLLGEAYLQVKKGSLAVGFMNEALRLDPQGKAEVHLRLALLYNGAGMKSKAANEYEEFLKKRPDYKDRKKLEQYIAENKKP